MKPSQVRNLINKIQPIFNNKLKVVNEKKDGSFSTVISGAARVMNIEKVKNGNYIVKFYPFLDMSEGHNWGVRESEYTTYVTPTVKRIMRSKYMGKQPNSFLKKNSLIGLRNTDTTIGAFVLDELDPAEVGTMLTLSIIAQAEQLVVRDAFNRSYENVKKECKNVFALKNCR